MDAWAYRNGVTLHFIRPGKPVSNESIETFNGRLRDECLNTNWLASLGQAQRVIEEWRWDYREARPFSSIGDMAPARYAASLITGSAVGN